MVFSILVLFCLAQNSGVFRIFEQLNASSFTYASLSAKELNHSVSNNSLSTNVMRNNAVSTHVVRASEETTASQAENSEFKQCELSEKSLRVCLDEPPILPLLVLLFIFPLIPFASRVLQRALNVPVLPRPRRIHLSLCRFQE